MNTDIGEVFLYFTDHSIFTVEIIDKALEIDMETFEEVEIASIKIKASISFEGSSENKRNWMENIKTMPISDLNTSEVFSSETDKFQEYLASHPEAFI